MQALRKPSSRADIIKVAQEAAAAMIADLRDEVERLKNENLVCRQESDQLRQRVESLERVMARSGLPIPTEPKPFWEIRDGRLIPRTRS